MNISEKRKIDIVRASITQAGVPTLLDDVLESAEICTDPVQLTVTENKTVVIKAEDIDRAEREAQGLTPYDGVSQIEVTVDTPVTNVQESKSVEYTENGEFTVAPDEGYDAVASVSVTVDVAGGGGDDPDPLHWHVGDIVLYDAANDKKVKTTKDTYNLDKYPADNFTPIGVIFFVNEDGSARMLALAAMSSTTPDTGSDISEAMPWGGGGFDIPELDNYTGVAAINDHGIVIDSPSINAYMPTYSSIIEVPALDGVRYYSGVNKPYMPSPYNADGSLNSEFYKQHADDTVFYEWSRQRNGTTYYMYTDKPGDQLDENTKLYGFSLGHNSFVPNYGFPQGGATGTNYTYLGLITDTTIYDGGVANFTTDFTSTGRTATRALLANSDMDGASNTAKILLYQGTNYVFDHVIGGDTVHDGVNMYFWSRYRDSDGKYYWFYTTDETPTAETEIFIKGNSPSSFVIDYGTVNKNNGTTWIKIGTVGDGAYVGSPISGGFASFSDGTFTRSSEGIIRYYWERYNESDGKTYFLYTNDDPEHITDSTKIFIIGNSTSSFVYDYGTINQYNGKNIYEIGTIGDSTKISGGTEGFLAHFTHFYPAPWKTSPVLYKEGDNPKNYPAACSTWRFHTLGTEQGDWYLPAEGENAIISSNFGFITESLIVVRTLRPDVKVCGLGIFSYLSSTEYSSLQPWYCGYCDGNCGPSNKISNIYVRAAAHVPALS